MRSPRRTQDRGFRRPVLVLNPRSGSVQVARDQLLETAGRYGVEVREAATPAELVVLARAAVADGADALGVAGGDGSLAAVAAVVIEAELPFVCVPAGTRNHFVSNNAYPLSGLGGRPRLDAGLLEVSALRRTEGEELGRALENLFSGRYQSGDGWARWTTTSFEVDAPAGTLEVGIDGEPVVLDTPVEFRIHAGALRVLLPPPRPVSRRPSASTTPARRRRALNLDQAQAARLVRLWRLLGRVGEREFGPRRDE